jgi:lipoprotein-anchoring transpeptidase ErfK/SrfK
MVSARLRISLSLVGLCALPAAAAADSLVIPGLGPEQPHARPAYRRVGFPPPQHDLFGRPLPPTGTEPRPSYRQTYNQFPPPGGRYGGGFIEFLMTGGRPEPIAPQYAGVAQPQLNFSGPIYGGPAPAEPTRRSGLPRSNLPDYAPQPSAYYGQGPASARPDPQGAIPQTVAYNASAAAYDPVAADPGMVTRPINPIYYRQTVDYAGHERPGTIVIDTPNKFLYLVQPGRQAIRYGIGVGRPGFSWSGVKTISRKAEWPAWTPPSEMLARRPDLPRHMEGGQANPLGARALYLGSSLYRIHGTNEPYTIGTNVSSGCIRMMNHDVIDLYSRVGVGTRVIVL